MADVPTRRTNSATVVFGCLSLAAGLLILVGSIGLVIALFAGAVLLLVGILGALTTASGARRKVAVLCGVQMLAVALFVAGGFTHFGIFPRAIVAALLILIGSVGVIVAGIRAPAR